LPGKREPDFLRSGDILFVARGSNHYAILYGGQFDKAVAAPHFFVIRIKSPCVIPEFIVWQLNQVSAQKYFEKASEGSVAKSIKRTSLEQVPISLPDIQQQQALLRLYKNLFEQKRTHHELITNIEKRMRILARELEQGFNNVIRRTEK
jgi:restriction endonuclease S subunit